MSRGPEGAAPHRPDGPARGTLAALAVVAAVLLAAWPLTRIYHGDLLDRLLLGAAVGPVLLALAVRRLPGWTAAPASVLALFGYTLLAVRLSAQAGGVPGELLPLWRDAVRNGIPRLLTALIPVEPQPDTVLVPVLATWLAGLTAAELALRYRRALAGLAPAAVLYAGALVVVGPNAHPPVWPPLAFAGAAVLVLLAVGTATAGAATAGPRARDAGWAAGSASPADRTVASPPDPVTGPDLAAPLATALARLPRGQRWRLRARMAAGGTLTLIVIVALAVTVGPAVAARLGGTPVDPRRYVTPPRVDLTDDNPLLRLSGWALAPKTRLFDTDIDTTADSDDLRIRLAVLSDYDGVNWRVDGDYRAAGRVLPGVTGPGAADVTGPAVQARVTIDDLDGRLLPAVGAVREIDGVRVGYDQLTGTLVRPEGLRAGLTYTLRGTLPTLNVNLLPGADVPTGPAVARYLQLGMGAPDDMAQLADQLGSDTAEPYQRALTLEQFLSDHYTLVGDAPSGHAYPNLSFFLFGPTNAGGQRGTSEQFAASFAVLGRMMGLPTRVVVGFRARPGRATVTAADALAWPEVLFDGLGWVPFDPLPQPDIPPRPVSDDFRPSPPPSDAPPSSVPTVSVSPAAPASPSASPTAVPAAGGSPLPAVGAGAGALVAVVLIGLGSVALARRVRRTRRLARGSPNDRVTGAWLELLDALRLAGAPAGAHQSVSEVVQHAFAVAGGEVQEGGGRGGRARLRLPAPPLDDLATLANAVAFAGGQADEAAARRAAAQSLAFAAELRSRRPWWRRLWWSVDPRPLRWHRPAPPPDMVVRDGR